MVSCTAGDGSDFDESDELSHSVEKPSPLAARAAESLAAGNAPASPTAFDERAVGPSGAGFEWAVPAAEAQRSSICPAPAPAADEAGYESDGGEWQCAGGLLCAVWLLPFRRIACSHVTACATLQYATPLHMRCHRYQFSTSRRQVPDYRPSHTYVTRRRGRRQCRRRWRGVWAGGPAHAGPGVHLPARGKGR